MIPNNEVRDVVSSGADDSSSFDISPDDVGHIMTILRDTLYSDKIMAVLREYSTNAWDANRMAGRGHVPIRVTLPTLADPTLYIRDNGEGLSHADIGRVYTRYGASTKRNSNDAAGMLGIGSKSGFAYSDSFTITTWHRGFKRIYIAVLNDTRGRCDLFHTEQCDEAETGLQISIAVAPKDIVLFEQKAKQLYQHFVPRPQINCQLDPEFVGRQVGDLGLIDEEPGSYYNSKWVATMGPVGYPIDLDQLRNVPNVSLAPVASRIKAVLRFDIGELQVAASREGLKYSDATKVTLINRINTIIDEYVRTLTTGLAGLSNWEKRLRTRVIVSKGLPLPAALKSIENSYVALSPRPSFSLTTANYKGKQTSTKSINVDQRVCFLIRDDARNIKGYNLKQTDVVVNVQNPNSWTQKEPSPSAIVTVKRELNEMIKAAEIDGISVELLSNRQWAKPTPLNGPAKPRDNARAQARRFRFDGTVGAGDRERAKQWIPIVGVPKDTDVYVVLDNYRSDGSSSFPETWDTDNRIMKKLGLSMPEVFGYKTTKAHPVNKDKLPGIHYDKWRTTKLVEMLSSVKEVSDALQAEAYPNWSLGRQPIVTMLGDDHIISRFITADDRGDRGRIGWSGLPEHVRWAARHIKTHADPKTLTAMVQINEIETTYPLLKVVGIPTISRGYEAWCDYVRLVDESNRRKQQEQQAA